MLVELVLLILLIAAASRGWKQGLIESLGIAGTISPFGGACRFAVDWFDVGERDARSRRFCLLCRLGRLRSS